jgi:Holliday junction DNA helicase RuvB
MATHRLVSAAATGTDADEQRNWSLRPTRIDEYVGQRELIDRLRIALAAAKGRSEPMEHVLLHGPPGLGKTTLAYVIAAEMGTRVSVTSGPALTRPLDLVTALKQLQPGDVLFIDEIHRMPAAVEEFIYPALEDFRIDVQLDSGLNARTVQMPLAPFTLIGATTRAGLVSGPLRSRFGIAHHLEYYGLEDLHTILERSAGLLGVDVGGRAGEGALRSIAARSRGTPRIANRLLRRVRDYAQVKLAGRVTESGVAGALELEGIDALGLDALDRAYLRALRTVFDGGPTGVEAIAATMNEDAGTLEDVVEPYLLQVGLLARTRRGRAITTRGCEHLGLPPVGGGPAGGGGGESGLF